MRNKEILNKSCEEGEVVDIQDISEQRELPLCMADITTASQNILAKKRKARVKCKNWDCFKNCLWVLKKLAKVLKPNL